VELTRVPSDGVASPRTLESGGDGVFPFPSSVGIGPAEALLFDGSALGVDADVRIRSCAMGFAERVPSGDERNCFLVIHGHSAESDPDVVRRCTRVVQHASGSFGVDLD